MNNVNGKTLKIIAIISMFIDHIGAAFLEPYLYFLEFNGPDVARVVISDRHQGLWMSFMGNAEFLWHIDMVLRLIGRISFPIFCFLLVEGFYHTRDVARYLIRLLVFSLVSEIPFDYAFFGKITFEYQNVFMTLFIGISFMYYAERLLNKAHFFEKIAVLAFIPAALMGALASFHCDTIAFLIDSFMGDVDFTDIRIRALMAFIGTVSALIIYFVVTHGWDRQKRARAFAVEVVLLIAMTAAFFVRSDYDLIGVLSIAVIWLSRRLGKTNRESTMLGCIALFVMNYAECTAFLSAVPIVRYNGEKGKYFKYFFYLFYPGHLLFLFWMRYMFMGM